MIYKVSSFNRFVIYKSKDGNENQVAFFCRKFFILTFVYYALTGCVPKATTLPEDMPLSEFMIGEWKVISRVNTDPGETLEIVFPKVSSSSELISYGDTYDAEYQFTGKNAIFVDNKRLIGGETWQLEREIEYLIVYQEYQGFKSTMRLERTKR